MIGAVTLLPQLDKAEAVCDVLIARHKEKPWLVHSASIEYTVPDRMMQQSIKMYLAGKGVFGDLVIGEGFPQIVIQPEQV